jgi:superoxide dismutase, Fe-Mn family
MTPTSRRGFLMTAAATSLVIESGVGLAGGEGMPVSGPTFDDQHIPLPLPFDPKNLNGLSSKLMQSHWENNYSGAVKALNTIRLRLTRALNDADTPPYVYTGLKREQLLRTGSVVLHEYYFGNLGGSGKPGADVRTKLAASFGTFDAWESEFRKIGQGLGGGSGWVVLGLNRKLKILENYWMADHATGPVDTTPVLVMDMYEHAYQMDYGAAAARYIDAFFANINWETVASRL